MPTYDEVVKAFAARIKQAVARDASYVTKGLIKKADLAASDLGSEILAIGRDLDSLKYEDDSPLTEETKEAIVEGMAKEIGWPQPKTLRRLTKGGSVDALLAMAQQLEALFAAVKK